ncbi:MAG: 5'-nucleotidase C-terminal domain-containing protein, partial [Burkholderiaceae bacterium]|nr:5'-nucleotidase C-terminal domain-containing protein [Microbacteriaceae bacterium]
ASSKFVAIVNHFKSKGSGSGAGDSDAKDGQGASNGSRVRQAESLVDFAEAQKTATGTARVFLLGDFNSYLMEDPMEVFQAAGYVDLGSSFTDKETYSFGGAIGSLDHILGSKAAVGAVTGVDIWNINSVESIALEYSRFNYNATNFYAPNAYRSSDHDPVIVGLDLTTIDVNLLNINDFHGRIDSNTVKFAGTVEQLRAQYGDGNTLFLSDGDNIGASVFASSSQLDKPTIDVLNVLELAASGVGNHEFDLGFDDLDGRVKAAADWNYLGANVYFAGTETPALDTHDIFTINGVRVAVIGTVTEETPTLVSPDGIAKLDFGNPVEAVNRVVAQLIADDEADVFVAEYHEGAGSGVVEGSSLEEELVDQTTAFYDIVMNTSPEVDAIFTGHTHKTYAWDAPIPGTAGETRPVLQTGSYGENIGQVVLSVDPSDDSIVDYTVQNTKRLATAAGADSTETAALSASLDARLVAQYPRVAEVSTVVAEAVASAAVLGNVPIGEITADITTPRGIGSGDRGSESNLSNLIADSLVETLSDPLLGGAEIGVVNPGGVRSDLLFAKSGAEETDGIVTFAEANAILPFVNNLWTTTLTGDQFKVVLEQQWQRDAAGNVPSRGFLHLGLSENVNYTFDAERAEGDRITSITINGEPIVADRGYRIGSFSFLLQGGDNFREFANGTQTRDSGLIDRDAWIEFIEDSSPLTPSFDRQAVSVTGVPTAALSAGDSSTVSLSGLDLTSLGAPATTAVSAKFEGSANASVVSTVTGGTSTVAFTVPADVAADATLVITALETGTVVRVPIAVNVVLDPTVRPIEVPVAVGVDALVPGLEDQIELSDMTLLPGQSITITLGAQYVDQYVSAYLNSLPMMLGGGWMRVDANGQIAVMIPTDAPAGNHRISVQDVNGNVIGWVAVTVAATGDVVVPGGSVPGSVGSVDPLAATGGELAPGLVGGAIVMMLIGAGLLALRRRDEVQG